MPIPDANGVVETEARTVETDARTVETDALVIGAGPVGLFQVFQLGLQGIHAELVDALPIPGGQCIQLYADKPIYDIPAVQVCTGRELVHRLLMQVAPFAPGWHLGQVVSTLSARADGRFDVATSSGTRFISRTLFIAAGVGAFMPRGLQAEGVDQLSAAQLHYQPPDHAAIAGRDVLVIGGDDAAIDAVLQLADGDDTLPNSARPGSITLLHRRHTLDVDSTLLQRFQALCATGAVRFEVGQVLRIAPDDSPDNIAGRMALQVIGDDSVTRQLQADHLVVLLGLSPKLGAIAHWGLAMARRQLAVDAAHCETSVPGIYAAGDVISYPGKKKLILCGFHEATLAAFAALARLRPDEPALLQYTTTSARLQQRLGVGPGRPAGVAVASAKPAGKG